MGRRVVRRDDWEYQLGCFLDEVSDRPRRLSVPRLRPEDWDCGHFVAEAVLRMTGRPVITWADCYGDWRVLAPLIKSAAAFEGYVKDMMTKIGAPDIPVAESRKGDVVVTSTKGNRRAITIRIGERCAAPGPAGLAFTSINQGLLAFRI